MSLPGRRSHGPVAAAVLASALGVGVAATRAGRRVGRLARAVTDGLAVTSLAAVPVLLIAARRGPCGAAPAPHALGAPPAPPSPGPLGDGRPPALEEGGQPFVSVLVPARNEALVIAGLVADIAVQDHRDPSGRPLFELVVVDDRSTDGTGGVARATADACGIGAITRVARRERTGKTGDAVMDGKGAALDSVDPGLLRGDVLVVLDADARVAPSVVRSLAAAVVGRPGAVTARRRELGQTLGGVRGLLARLQDDEQTVDGHLQRARRALGGTGEFRGNGMALRHSDLVAAGGWGTRALCEDLELSNRFVARTGAPIEWLSGVEVWEQPVLSLRALWPQRARWCEGVVRRDLTQTIRVLSSRRLPLIAKLDRFAYATQVVTPVVMGGTIVGAAARGGRGPAFRLCGAYLGAATIVATQALRHETGGPRRRRECVDAVLRGLGVAAFSALWLPGLVVGWARVALRPDVIRFEPTVHTLAPAAADPEHEIRPIGRLTCIPLSQAGRLPERRSSHDGRRSQVGGR